MNQMNVPFFNYSAAFKLLKEEFHLALDDVIERGAFIQQQDLLDFENNLANYLGVKHASGVGNATDGLTMIWRAIGLRENDEVIFPSHTMVATAASIVHGGGRPIAVDCGSDHLIDPSSIVKAITPRTRAIMPVHLNGRTAPMDSILEICEHYNLLLVEDAAQALGSKFDNRFAGSFGVAAVFSFYPAKLLGCLGDGGAIVSNSDEIMSQIALLRDHGRSPDNGKVTQWGYNSRLDNLQAAFLNVQFPHYESFIQRRREVAQKYIDGLSDCSQIVTPPPPLDSGKNYDVFQNFEVEADFRDQLQTFLAERGVGTIRQWGGYAVHQFDDLNVVGECPATDALFEKCLMLPMNTVITDEEVDYIVNCIRQFYSKAVV